jgi:DNA-binding Lrp family transcriptional regulator
MQVYIIFIVVVMPIAFVLINTEIGFMESVLQGMKSISNVKEAYSVYGVYDIIARVEAETMDKVKDIVTWQIRKMNNVRTTLTMIVIEKIED